MNQTIKTDSEPPPSQSVTDLVAEGGNTLASDDAPVPTVESAPSAVVPDGTIPTTPRIDPILVPAKAAIRSTLRTRASPRPTLHLPTTHT